MEFPYSAYYMSLPPTFWFRWNHKCSTCTSSSVSGTTEKFYGGWRGNKHEVDSVSPIDNSAVSSDADDDRPFAIPFPMTLSLDVCI